MKDWFLLKMIWIAAFSVAYVTEFRQQQQAGNFDVALRYSSGEEPWSIADGAVAAFKHHRGPAVRAEDGGYRGGYSLERQEPKWE
jgi:hypothetical protein